MYNIILFILCRVCKAALDTIKLPFDRNFNETTKSDPIIPQKVVFSRAFTRIFQDFLKFFFLCLFTNVVNRGIIKWRMRLRTR